MFWNVCLGKQTLIILSLLSSISEIKTIKQDLYDIGVEVGDIIKINVPINASKTFTSQS